MRVTWVLEPNVFPARDAAVEVAARHARHAVVHWNDDWWVSCAWPRLDGQAVVFHGSLGNAARIAAELPWRPGAYCRASAFDCTAWYDRAGEWLVHRQWRALPANQLTADPRSVLRELGAAEEAFVRPNSCLKPFSGRVLRREEMTLESLDFGFYYDDPSIEVIVTPVRAIDREWRYVVAGRRVVAGSGYDAAGRTALPEDPTGGPWALAAEIAAALDPPEEVYVMDVCESDGRLWLMELNPFSGADLYACDADAIVAMVSEAALRSVTSGPAPV